jgi:hypothetical protein
MTLTAVAAPSGTSGKFNVDVVIDAMRDLHSEHDRWHLSDVLLAQVPVGGGWAEFDAIIAKADEEGIAGGLSAKSLQLYRDTAAKWPEAKRIKGLSFSAHREAQPLIDVFNVDKAIDVLNGTIKQNGLANVTIKKVRDAVAAAQNKPLPSEKAGKAMTTYDAVIADLRSGGKELIAAIGRPDRDALKELKVGLTRVLGQVDKLEAKAVQRAAAAKTPEATPAPARAKPAASNGASRKRGDLRDL